MVCLGPRKKEKKANGSEERGVKKTATSRLKNSKAINSLTPSVASRKTVASSNRSSLVAPGDSHLPRPTSRTSILASGKSPNRKSPPTSRPTSIAASVKGATTITTTTTAKSRASGIGTAGNRASVTSTAGNRTSVASTAGNRTSVTGSAASTTKKFPISEMKEEVKDLKAKVTYMISFKHPRREY
jgi:hypothetical protein